MNPPAALDRTDWAILEALQNDGRSTLTALGRRVGLSTSGVTERVRRLEEAGVIRGYRAVVDAAAAGWNIEAVVRIHIPGARFDRINRLLPGLPEVYHCLRVAGEDCYVALVRASSLEHLDRVVAALAETGSTTTAIAYETVVEPGPIGPAGDTG